MTPAQQTNLMDSATLRHVVAGIRFRFVHVFADAPADFAEVRVGEGGRTVLDITDHLTQLAKFSLQVFMPDTSRELETVPWDASYQRFLAALTALDDALAQQKVSPDSPMTLEQMLHGPLLDMATHIGQLAMLRRVAGSPVRRVRYWQAEVNVPDKH